MKAVRSLCVGVGLTLLLSACGLFNSFIPDQAVPNAFGLDGETVAMEGVSPSGLAAQQEVIKTAEFSGPFATTFADFDDSEMPSGVGPSGISEGLTFETAVTMVSEAGADGDFPDTLTITSASVALTVTDGSGAPSLTRTYESAEGVTLTMTKDAACTGVGPITCNYTIGSVPTALIALSLAGAEFDTFYQILTEGESPNSVSGETSIALEPGIPIDTTVSITLDTSEGTLTF